MRKCTTILYIVLKSYNHTNNSFKIYHHCLPKQPLKNQQSNKYSLIVITFPPFNLQIIINYIHEVINLKKDLRQFLAFLFITNFLIIKLSKLPISNNVTLSC
ncbi:hypothetical protein Peur_018227 [Populus x canadensis]